MTKPARHELDLYGAVLHIACTQRQWSKIAQRIDELNEPLTSSGRTSFRLWVPNVGHSVAHLAVFVSRLDYPETPELVNAIAHEAAHAAGFLLDHIGQEYDGQCEAYAYLVGWIAEKIWAHVRRGG